MVSHTLFLRQETTVHCRNSMPQLQIRNFHGRMMRKQNLSCHWVPYSVGSLRRSHMDIPEYGLGIIQCRLLNFYSVFKHSLW